MAVSVIQKRKIKILLTSVCQPFGKQCGDSFFCTFDGADQLMWAQGLFRTFGTTDQWGIDFIAANLEAPTTTLHYPTMGRFIKEVKKGYDYVGIAFVDSTYHKMVPMVDAVRTYSSKTRIILGGYGTVLPDDDLAPYSDYICRGEGVEFMRNLLGEPDVRPLTQPAITSRSTFLSVPLAEEGYIFGSLGCPNGCDFCATSHFFKRKKIRFLPDGKSIVDAIKQFRSIHPHINEFWLCDEDFFVDKDRAHEFLEEMRKSDLPPLSLSGLGSVRSISQFSMTELVEMGFDRLWIGYEGKRAGYDKMKGRPYKELFDDLRSHGINTIASMILGLEYQTPEIIEEEFQELMSLKPTTCQFLIYSPVYGTALYERLAAEGRLRSDIMSDKRKHEGTWLAFKHPHIGQTEMRSIQRRLYKNEFRYLGPSALRHFETNLNGYITLKNHPLSRVREKAQMFRQSARRAIGLIPASKKYLDRSLYQWLDEFRRRIIVETGRAGTRELFAQTIAPLLFRITDLRMRHLKPRQPRFSIRRYRM